MLGLEALGPTFGARIFATFDAPRISARFVLTIAAAFLVTLHDVAGELMETVGAPPEALEPLIRRTVENGFRHTGPLVRGDRATIESHLEAIGARRPDLLPLYRALADAEAALLGARAR